MSFNTLDTADLNGKTVLVRADLNVPAKDGKVTDLTRVDRVKPTIDTLKAKGAKIVVMCHFGRPKGRDTENSVKFLVPVLAERWGVTVTFADDCVGDAAKAAVTAAKPGDVVLLENLRFHKEEEGNDQNFARNLAALADVYVNDAFSVSHRAHASVEAVARLLPTYAGLSMESELRSLEAALEKPKRPVAGIVGGAKVSTKLDLLGNLIGKLDVLVLGGGMANTFLMAKGWKPGKSLVEAEMLDTARKIMERAEDTGCRIILPVDMVAASAFSAQADTKTVELADMPQDYMALDLGPQSVELVKDVLEDCETLLWNGPMGAFEMAPFAKATMGVAEYAADRVSRNDLIAIAGGGDTVAALAAAGVEDKLTYVSTAGGAFLEWLEGKTLPGVAALLEAGEKTPNKLAGAA